MKRPDFTREQEDWFCYILDEWYYSWKGRIAKEEHRLGIAKEELKSLFCGESLFEIGKSMAIFNMISPLEYVQHYLKDCDENNKNTTETVEKT